MLPTPGWAGLGPKVVSCVATCVGNKRAKLIVELDSCGEGAIMFLGNPTGEVQLEVHVQGAGKAKGEEAGREYLV